MSLKYRDMSREDLKAAVIGGDATAMLELGVRYISGRNEQVDNVKGEKWLIASSNGGNVQAQVLLGMFYYQGKNKADGEKPDYDKALFYFEKAASVGHAGAMNAADGLRREMERGKGASVEKCAYSYDLNMNFAVGYGTFERGVPQRISERQAFAFRKVMEKSRPTKTGERDYLAELGWVGILGIVAL